MERYKNYFLVLVCVFVGISTINYTYSAPEEAEVVATEGGEAKKTVEKAVEEVGGETFEEEKTEDVAEEEVEAIAEEESAEEKVSTEGEAAAEDVSEEEAEEETIEEEVALEEVAEDETKEQEDIVPEAEKEVVEKVVEGEAVPQEEDEEVGPDTVTLSEEKIGFRGNWVKKREWLLRAKDQNDKIQTLASDVKKKPSSFREKFNKIQSELDLFYRRAGKTEGKLELIKRALEQQQQEKESLVVKKPTAIKEDSWHKRLLSSFLGITDWIHDNIVGWFAGKKEEPPVKAVTEIKEETSVVKDKALDVALQPNELELLRKDVKTVKDLDDALVKRIDKLAEQVSLVNEEASRANGLLDEIWDMIDDAKAQANFYAMKTATKKIKSIKDYIDGNFASDFDATIETIKKEMNKVNERIEALEGAGFIAKDEGIASPRQEISKPIKEVAPEKAEEPTVS